MTSRDVEGSRGAESGSLGCDRAALEKAGYVYASGRGKIGFMTEACESVEAEGERGVAVAPPWFDRRWWGCRIGTLIFLTRGLGAAAALQSSIAIVRNWQRASSGMYRQRCGVRVPSMAPDSITQQGYREDAGDLRSA